MARITISKNTKSFISKLLESKKLDKILTLLTIAIACYSIYQVNEIDIRQESKEKVDSVYKAKQLVLDSLQNIYMEISQEFLSSIDTSSKSIDKNFTNISQNMEGVPHRIDKVNELLNSLSRVTREHKNLIENQLKQRARLLLEDKGINGIGSHSIKIVNRGEKIAIVKEIEFQIISGLIDEVLLNEFYREEYYQMTEKNKGTFHIDFYRNIPVPQEYLIGFMPKFKGDYTTDFTANIKIFYEWDGDKKGDVLMGTVSSK